VWRLGSARLGARCCCGGLDEEGEHAGGECFGCGAGVEEGSRGDGLCGEVGDAVALEWESIEGRLGGSGGDAGYLAERFVAIDDCD